MGKNIGKNKSKNLSSKYSQKLLHHAKQSATDALKTASKRAIHKTAEATGDFIGNKIANKISKKSLQNTSETVDCETEIPKERYISPEERQQYNNTIMKYRKIDNLVDNSLNQRSKFITRNWVGINDDSCGTYNIEHNLNSSLCDYSDAYIAVKGTITVPNTGTAATSNNINKGVVFKNCAPFTDCMSEISNV